MIAPKRGEVWLVDLGMAAKVRPALVLSIPANDTDRALATIPHAKLLRSLGKLNPQQLAVVETAVRSWLGLSAPEV